MWKKSDRWKIIIFISLSVLLLITFNVINFMFNDVNYLIANFRFSLILIGLEIVILTYSVKSKKLFVGTLIIDLTLIYNLLEIYLNSLKDYYLPLYLFLLFGLILIVLGVRDLLNERTRFIKQIKQLTFYDSVTGLGSRNIILKSCPTKEVIKCNDSKCSFYENETEFFNKNVSVLVLDIDGFKLVNDNLGFTYGDILLKQVAERLKSFLRKSDTILHLSADEFLIILYDIDNVIDAEIITQRILERFRPSFTLINEKIDITCSIGLAMYQNNGNSVLEIVEKAGIALSEAKKAGKNKYIIFSDELKDAYIKRYEKIQDLKSAVKNDEFIVHYQPKADLKTNQIFSLEALSRWNHPQLGLIYPNDFIPLAEEIGIIREIDLLVLRKACKQIEDWLKNGDLSYNITVNISPLFFMEIDFIDKIDETISEYNINPSTIGIEITETIAIKNIENTRMKIEALRKRKIKVYLDDFGKGYSSLTYLKYFPVDYVKIDKSFIDGIKVNQIDEEIITYINNMCLLLGIKVISEGIETMEQLDFVKNKGCFGYQGYLLSKPMVIEDLKLIKKG